MVNANLTCSKVGENDDALGACASEMSGRISKSENLEQLIEAILNETEDLETNNAKSHVSRTMNTRERSDLSTQAEDRFVKPGKLENLKTDVDLNSRSLVSDWLLKQKYHLSNASLENIRDSPLCTLDISKLSESTRNIPVHSRETSGQLSAISSDMTSTESSNGSSSSTPRPERSEVLSDPANFSDDSLRSIPSHDDVILGNDDVIAAYQNTTSVHDVLPSQSDVIGERRMGTSSESTNESMSFAGDWTTSSVTFSLTSTRSGLKSHDRKAPRQGKRLVHSRLSHCKSETSVTGSDSTYSEEEEIVWRRGNMLGKGAFGKVYCGLTNTGQMIAVKQVELITSNMKQAERQYEKLQEEVALLRSLRHENVVSYLGTCLDGGVVNIFMQFVPGGSIASIRARFGPLEERVFRFYTKQILVGVEYLHRKNVVHRDIKGGNIMLMPTGVIKLIDFGCAKRLYMNMSQSRGDLLRSMKGTPYWMAPEVIKETGYGKKSDIWSIGCTVFEMATGKPPWSHLPPMSAILAIGQGSQPPKLEQPNSEEERDFVAISMAREPEERLSAEELLEHPFILQCDKDQR